jgi:hypothetical protein
MARLSRKHPRTHMFRSLIFSKAADDWCMSHEFMFMASCRHMAISCRERMVHSCPRLPRGALVQANYEFNSCLHQRQSGSHGLQSDFYGCQEDGLRQRWDEDNHSSSSFCSLVFKLVGIFFPSQRTYYCDAA